ncbi:hypothetical protein [uncultured Cellulomonas sp.]|uniref:hypothetical protein n=1 Tax=uncultured Cellulomonas sp. TaxID=189682 RepID=UPI0026216E6C|nr:hypothetical protein [uncultured Cellulomonas sp.]
MDGVVGRGTLLAGRYRTLEPLDSDLAGASSWDATDQILDRPVRVTVLHSGSVPQALDAARRAALVTDPRLLRVLDVGEHEGVAYTVSEQVTGPSLADLVARGPLPADQARAIVGEAASALEAARRRGVHHGALRPSVLHLTPDDRVVVTGVAVDAALLGQDTTDATAASRADTLGLVALLYAALTGRWPATPFGDGPGARPGSSLDDAPLLEGAPVPPAEVASGVPNDLDTLCAVTLGVHDDGPRTPAELVQELEPWGDIHATDLFAVTRPISLPSPPRRPASPPRGTPAAPARVQRTSVRSAFAEHAGSVPSRPGTPPPATPTRSSAFTGPAVGAGVGSTAAGAAARAAGTAGAAGAAGGAAGAGGAGAAAPTRPVTDGDGAPPTAPMPTTGATTGAAPPTETLPPATGSDAAAGAPVATSTTETPTETPTTQMPSVGGAPAAASGTPEPVRAEPTAPADRDRASDDAVTAGPGTPDEVPDAARPPATATVPVADGEGRPSREAAPTAAVPVADGEGRPSREAAPTAAVPVADGAAGSRDGAAASPHRAAASPAPESVDAADPADPVDAADAADPAPLRPTTPEGRTAATADRGTAGTTGAPSAAPGNPMASARATPASAGASTAAPAAPASLLPGGRPGGLDVAAARESIAAHRFDPTRLVLLMVGLAIVLGLFIAAQALTRPVGPPAAEQPAPVATEPPPAEEPAPEEPAPQEPAPEEPAPPAPPVIASGAQLDPPPAGDENEHPEAVPLAIDGDPGTVWYTRTYSTPTFGGLKTGVGYAVTLAEPATVSTVTLDVRGSGGQVEVRATDPSTPTEGAVLASGALGPGTTLTLSEPTETQNLVLWFTELPQTEDGSNRVELAEVAVS